MTDFNITFLPSGKSIAVTPGTTILDAAYKAEVQLDAPCGGNGTCGKCSVRVVEGDPPGIVQACRTEIHMDMKVELPEKGKHHILTTTSDKGFDLDPLIRRLSIDIPRGDREDHRSEWDRLKNACGLKNAPPNTALAAKLPEILAGEATRLEAIMSDNEILDVRPVGGKLGIMAYDIGTTSIVGWLLDAETGETLALSSMLNPQSQYGADVIQRANYAIENGVMPLAKSVRSALNDLAAVTAEEAGISVDDIYLAVLVGNTCMHHLFLGLSPASLVLAPYRPAMSEPLALPSKETIAINSLGKLLFLPNIAGFVGSDTVGVMLAAGYDQLDDITLAIDIGTNGEMVLGNREQMTVCSTAAGPAFEGAKISCGMRGTTGAIDHLHFSEDTIHYSVIGDGKPVGICGSGLMDLMAGLVEIGLVDASGKFVDDSNTPLSNQIIEIDGQPAFQVAEGVHLTQRDVREVQLAKSAMAAGIQLLLKSMNLRVEDIKHVLIAGAFGNYMYASSACRIGLIPPSLEPLVVPVGNAAGEGARMVALSRKEWKRVKKMGQTSQYLDLAADPDFQDCFVDELEFPEMN